MDWLDHKESKIGDLIRLLCLWGVVSLVVYSDSPAVLRHGDQAVVVSGTPGGTVRIRTIPVERSGGGWGMGAVLGQAQEGQMFKFLEKRDFSNQGIWVRVERKNGTEAWISGKYLDQMIARDRLIVRPTTVNVRNRASRNSEKIGAVNKGDVLGRVRKQDNWYLAVLPDGKKRGWVRDDMVRLEVLAAKEKAPEKKKQEPPTEPEKPKVDYPDVAQKAVAAGKRSEAIYAYSKALEEEPNNGIFHFEIGKLLAKEGKPEQAIPHFRKAIEGRPPRPEAEFSLRKLLDERVQAAGAGTAKEEEPQELEEDIDEGSPMFEILADNAVYILPTAAVGSLVFIAVLLVLYRRRRVGEPKPSFRRRNPDGGFDDVLKYAVEKRPVIRQIEEAEKKLIEMDEALAKRFSAFQEKDEDGRPRLPPGESAERLLKRMDSLRKTVLNQEERARIYSDLVVLQNDKISAMDDEIDALKKLIQLDYREVKGEPKRASASPKKAPQKKTLTETDTRSPESRST